MHSVRCLLGVLCIVFVGVHGRRCTPGGDGYQAEPPHWREGSRWLHSQVGDRGNRQLGVRPGRSVTVVALCNKYCSISMHRMLPPRITSLTARVNMEGADSNPRTTHTP